MKKGLLAIVTVIALASCAEKMTLNTIENNEQPTVIGFNTISEKATKANLENLEVYHNTFAAYATKKTNNDENAQPEIVFRGEATDTTAADIITYDATRQHPNNWTYDPYRYWDKQATYNFVAVAPNAAIIKYDHPEDVAAGEGTYVTVNAGGYTLVGQNLQTSTEPALAEKKVGFTGGDGKDTDLMTAGKITRDGATGNAADVSLEFKHILAKLNIRIAKDKTLDNVKILIKKVEVVGLDDNGTYVETSSTTASGWHSALSANGANYKLSWANADGIELLKGTGEGDAYEPGKPLYFIESLIMPQSIDENVETLKIDYTIVSGTNAQNYNYQLKLDDGNNNKVFESFMERNNYTITLTVRPNVITFDASTAVWTDKNAETNIVPLDNE